MKVSWVYQRLYAREIRKSDREAHIANAVSYRESLP